MKPNLAKKTIFTIALCLINIGCFAHLSDYSIIYGVFVKTSSLEEQEKIEDIFISLERKYGVQFVVSNNSAQPKEFEKLKGALFFSLIPPNFSNAENELNDSEKSSGQLIDKMIWPVDPTIGSTFKSQGYIFMKTGEIFFDSRSEIGGGVQPSMILTSIEQNLEKTLSMHKYKKPLVILFF